jgi:sec-independent protein translocase protein TatB
MFGVDSTELIIVAVLALLFIGPKELPATMRTVGRWVGKMRAMSRHFTSGIEAMIREAELEEMEKKWREENERIMSEHPQLEPPTVDPAPKSEPAASDEPRLPLGDSEKPELP